MKTILLTAVIAECTLLALLSLLKKLTKPAFYLISMLTVLCCTGIWLVSRETQTTAIKADERSHVYMAARLIEEKYYDKALEILSDVSDEEVQQYKGRAVRALGYNLNGAYQTLEYYLSSDTNDEMEQIILDASQKKEAVGLADQEKILGASFAAIHAKEDETKRWETEMKVRFMGFIPMEEELREISDTAALIKLAVTDNRYHDAYSQAVSAAEAGDIRAAILVSEMYAGNYQKINLAGADSEYAHLWEQAADLRSDLNTASLAITGENASDDHKNEYDLVKARYELAMSELGEESIKRAVNYLKAFDTSESPDQLGYQLQMARLAFMAGQVDEARKRISDIFTTASIDDSRWLSQDCAMFREAYIRFLSDQSEKEHNLLFDSLMLSLYQSVFPEDCDAMFKEFVMSCMKDIFGGMVIREVNTSEFPQISAKVSAINPELVLDTNTVFLSDTGIAIDNFTVTVNELDNLNISFVLDKSGSMSGNNITESKLAIRNCISQMSEGVHFSLVTFDTTASLSCALTDSRYLIMSMVEKVNADGGTNIASGLNLANESLDQASGERIIILLSDGLDNDESKNLMDIVLKDTAAKGITVYTIGLEGCDEDYLRRIAEETNGQFIMVSDPVQLERTYQDIQNAILNTYLLHYQVDGKEEERSILVRLSHSFCEARKDYLLSAQGSAVSYYENGLQESGYYRQTGGTDIGRG